MIIRMVIVLFSIVPLAAEAARKFVDYPIQPIVEYAVHSVADGHAVAIDAIRDKKSLKSYFDKDMVSEGD